MEVSPAVVATSIAFCVPLGRSHFSDDFACHPNQMVSFYLCNRSCTTRMNTLPGFYLLVRYTEVRVYNYTVVNTGRDTV